MRSGSGLTSTTPEAPTAWRIPSMTLEGTSWVTRMRIAPVESGMEGSLIVAGCGATDHHQPSIRNGQPIFIQPCSWRQLGALLPVLTYAVCHPGQLAEWAPHMMDILQHKCKP